MNEGDVEVPVEVMPDAGGPAALAAVLSVPLRLSILHRLLEGPAPVQELVQATGASQSNVSNHLAVLRASRLVTVVADGRHRIYSIVDPAVSGLIENLIALAGPPSPGVAYGPLVAARTCYDHLGGEIAVSILYALIDRGALIGADHDRGDLACGVNAVPIFTELGVDVRAADAPRRRLAYACLDWTQQRHHLGGALGNALLRAFRDSHYVTAVPGSRAVSVTPEGHRALRAILGVALPEASPDNVVSRT